MRLTLQIHFKVALSHKVYDDVHTLLVRYPQDLAWPRAVFSMIRSTSLQSKSTDLVGKLLRFAARAPAQHVPVTARGTRCLLVDAMVSANFVCEEVKFLLRAARKRHTKRLSSYAESKMRRCSPSSRENFFCTEALGELNCSDANAGSSSMDQHPRSFLHFSNQDQSLECYRKGNIGSAQP